MTGVGGTSDGITPEDWDLVHQLAVDIVNASAVDDDPLRSSLNRRMLDLLDALQAKYGALPSILFVRASYVEGPEAEEHWLLAAYDAALRLGDGACLVDVASSLAAFYLEDSVDRVRGAQWVATLERHLQAHPDPREEKSLHQLRAKLEAHD